MEKVTLKIEMPEDIRDLAEKHEIEGVRVRRLYDLSGNPGVWKPYLNEGNDIILSFDPDEIYQTGIYEVAFEFPSGRRWVHRAFQVFDNKPIKRKVA